LKDAKGHGKSIQLRLEGFLHEDKGEPENNVEAPSITSTSERGRNDDKVYSEGMLEKILSKDNMNKAYKKVKANKGAPGIDRMKVEELFGYLRQHGEELRQELLEGRFTPNPVRRKKIPKPDGGERLLGIPTAIDRVIQQSIAQVLIPIYEKKFVDNSYGFRPLRDAKQAIRKSKEYLNEGHTWIVDIDLERYFDTVDHDKLMRIISKDVKDGRVISLIRKYLKSGVMTNGVVIETEEGTPQGGPLSPLLSNIMLHELDVELTKRGHKFCRYADDCNIYVKSEKSAYRVMESITRFIEKKLKLKVNRKKSKVVRPWDLKYLGFSFYVKEEKYEIRVHGKSIKEFKKKLKGETKRSSGRSMTYRLSRIKQIITGWINYYGIANMKSAAKSLDGWLRRRIRMCIWKGWKKIKTRYKNLVKLGLNTNKAWRYANTRKGYWRISNSPILSRTLTNKHLKKMGLTSILETYNLKHEFC